MNVSPIDRQTFQKLAQLLQEHPEVDVDRLRELIEGGGRKRRPAAELIRPKSAGELVALVEAGILTKAEARRFMRLARARRRPTSREES